MNKETDEARKLKQILSRNCASCTHCRESRCKIFSRYVKTDYNKCAFHSDITPNAQPYVPEPDLARNVLNENKRVISYLYEHNQGLKELLKEVNKAA